MAVPGAYQLDLKAILDRRRDNGDDFWSTPDDKIGKGSPFATVDCALMLSELGMKRSDPILKGTAERIFATWQEDGRFRVAPKGTVYPCHTAIAARALCYLGYVKDRRLKKTFEHLLEIQHTDGGWRCNTTKLGRGPVTDASNPGVTLWVLDAFRSTPYLNAEPRLDKAVMTLLKHWKTRTPLGPCAFGIGTLFMQVEYPMFRYNLFSYVHTLSFYEAARGHAAFRAAYRALESKLVDGEIVVENPKRDLAKFAFCAKGQPSRLATKSYHEILKNLGR